MSNSGARKWQDLYDWQRDAAIAWQRGELTAHERAELAIDVAPEAAAAALDAIIAPWAVPYELEMRAQQDAVARACVGLGVAIAEFVRPVPHWSCKQCGLVPSAADVAAWVPCVACGYAVSVYSERIRFGAAAPTHPLVSVARPGADPAADSVERALAALPTGVPVTRLCSHNEWVRLEGNGPPICVDCGAAVSP